MKRNLKNMIKFSDIEVEYLDHMGDDLTVVNAAKVSNHKKSVWLDPVNKILDPKDVNLIEYLARGIPNKEWENIVTELITLGNEAYSIYYPNENYEILRNKFKEKLWKIKHTATHFMPFNHCVTSFRIKVPIYLSRQLAKHQIGGSWSEVSRRYVTEVPEFYMPRFRKKAENVKQGSSDVEIELYNEVIHEWIGHTTLGEVVHELLEDELTVYELLKKHEVAPEQARIFLTLNMMTEFIWTGSLTFWARVYNQRSDPHAQKENLEVVKPISDKMFELYPKSWYALTVPH